MRDRIDQKIKDIESDIEAIKNNEALFLYNLPKQEVIEKSKNEQIQFQLRRIELLKALRRMGKKHIKKELIALESINSPTIDNLVDIDLYRIALGVL